MFRYLTLAIAFSFLSTAISVSENVSRGDKITVDVYYESLCPYSVDFVTKTLVPDYDFFKDFIRINFIPFGKAQYIIGNPTTFTCQHGPNECYGNRAQACALYEVQQTVKTENQQQRAIDVVGCVMGSDDPTNAVLECAAKTGFKKESIKNIRDCMSNDLGNALLVAYGDKTKEFESPLLGVPSVAINGPMSLTAFSQRGLYPKFLSMKGHAPTEETLITVLAEIENSLNSRPLTHVSLDPRDREALTPNHFLLGSSSGTVGLAHYNMQSLCLKKQWHLAQQFADAFWNRWVREYLPTLTSRNKWFRSSGEKLRVGDIVLIIDNNAARNNWRKGVIIKTYPDKENEVRIVDVRTADGMLKRPSHKIIKFASV